MCTLYEYIAQQEAPVPVKDILGYLSAKTDRRTLNQILIAMTRDGDLKKQLKDGKAYYTAPEARKAKILNQLDAEITRLENMAKDMGLDLHPSNIGDTGFDMYRWTFTKGTRKSGSGWSVAIPDSFSVIDSEDDRPFEAVPQGKETEKLDDRRVQILPGKTYDFSAIQGEKWSYHLQARKGRVDAYAATMAQFYNKNMGAFMDLPTDGFSVVTEDVCASVLMQDTSGGSFSYLIQMLTEGKSQTLRVQTSFMTQEQKAQMTRSVTEWVKTFRFDKPNPAIPKKAPLSDPGILTQLKNGFTSAFDKEVDLAVEEAKYGLVGQLALQKYRVEQDLAEGDGSAAVQAAMDSGMESTAYYTRMADELVTKAEKGKLPTKTMQHIYKKLQDLIIRMDNLRVNGTLIQCHVPGDIEKIWEKWVSAEETAKQQKGQNPPLPSTGNTVIASPQNSAQSPIEALKERVKQKALKREEEYCREREAAEKAEMDEYQQKMQDYRAACARYELEQRKVKQAQEDHFQKLCTKERDSYIKEIDKVYQSTCSKVAAEISYQQKRQAQAKETLNQLKFWNFLKKSEQNKIIEDAAQVIARKEGERSDAKRTWQNEKDKVTQRVKQKESQFQQMVKNAHPLPVKPTEPNRPISPQTTKHYSTIGSSRSDSGTSSEAAIRNRKLAEILMERMEYGVWYNAYDLIELLGDECPGCSTSKMSAIMRHTGENVEYDSRESGRVYRLRESGGRNRSGFRQPPQKPSGFNTENERLAGILLGRMEYGVGYTGPELAELMQDVCPGCTSSKITAIMRHIPEGRVKVEKNEEGRNVYSLA